MKKNRIFIVSILVFISNIASANNNGYADIVEPLMPAVVNINTVKFYDNKNKRAIHPQFEQFEDLFKHFGMPHIFDEMPNNPKAMSLGSGFIIDSTGYVVTNHHVIADADEISVKLNNNKEFNAKVIGSDPKTDTALLKIESKEPLPFVRFGDSSKARVGDIVIAIGNPFGLGGTVTSGIVSSKARDIDYFSDSLVDDYIQTDAAINKGNSGGPLFNFNGEVIGINTSISAAGGGVNVGISFAIPSNTVKEIVELLKKSGKIERGRLGILIQELTPELIDGLGLKNTEGVLISTVDKDGAADKAGIKNGDIITNYDGSKVTSIRKLQILVAETPLDKEVEVIVSRKGKEIKLKAKILASKPLNSQGKTTDYSNSASEIINGVEFADINSMLVDKFSISETSGVVVVNNKSKGFWSSLKTGDLVKSVNQISVKTAKELKNICDKTHKSGKKNIVFLIKRNDVTIFLALPIE